MSSARGGRYGALRWRDLPVKKLPFAAALIVFVAAAEPAFAHHVMGGRMASTFGGGLVSGLGHPVIGIDHFAAVVAIGCLAAAGSNGVALVIGYIVAMIC